MKGCYNHPPYRESYPAQDGYYPSEPGMHDEKCKGCVWRKPEMVRA